MKTKILIFLVMIMIIASIFLVQNLKEKQFAQPENPKTGLLPEEIPENEFKDLNLLYYGEENKYRLDTSLKHVIQESSEHLFFQELEAFLQDSTKTEGQILQQISTREGWMKTAAGIVHLKGSIVLEGNDIQLFSDNLEIDLNQGEFMAQGSVVVNGSKFEVTAQKMSSDFQLRKIHFSGRPTLIMKIGD